MAETKKRIIQYNEETTPALDDYLLLDSPTAGTRKILALNIGGGGGNANVTELTYAQYMALTPAERTNGTIYCVTDDPNDSNVHIPVNYSTAEQDTGLKWVDGKPIYQKTIVLSLGDIDVITLNIDTFVKAEGRWESTSGVNNAIDCCGATGAPPFLSKLAYTPSQGQLTFSVSGWTFLSGYATIYYTKTTD